MLKKTVAYTDYDGNAATETLYFNLTKGELLENIDLKDQFEPLAKKLDGPERELTIEEVKEIIAMVKKIMQLSYGVRSDDGKRFIKSDELWTEFTQTAVYDSFLFSLFENPANAVDFLVNMIPADLRAQVEAEAKKSTGVNLDELTPEQLEEIRKKLAGE